MKRLGGILLRAGLLLAALVLAGVLWHGAVEGWIRRELMALAASQLEPALGIERVRYRFPRTVSLGNVRLTQLEGWPDGSAPEILVIDTVTLELAGIPVPDAPFRVKQITLARPVLRLIPAGEGFVGWETLLKQSPLGSRDPGSPSGEPGDYFGVLEVDVNAGQAERLRADGAPAWHQDGIEAALRISSAGGGRVSVELSVDSPPELARLARERNIAGQIATMLSRTAR